MNDAKKRPIEGLKLEVAKEHEWGEVLSVIQDAYAEFEGDSDEEFWKGYQRSIEKTILEDDSVIRIVAKDRTSDGDKIVAAVLYCLPHERQLGNAVVKNPFPEFRLLAVPPQSRNRGLAGLLIEHCEAMAREAGSPTITLHTTVLMQTAKNMYERRHYIRYPEIDFEPVPGFIVWGYRKDFAEPDTE